MLHKEADIWTWTLVTFGAALLTVNEPWFRSWFLPITHAG